MSNVGTPIYHAVCEDLQIYPLAMKPRTHSGFMRDRHQAEWLSDALVKANQPAAPAARRPARKRSTARTGTHDRES